MESKSETKRKAIQSGSLEQNSEDTVRVKFEEWCMKENIHPEVHDWEWKVWKACASGYQTRLRDSANKWISIKGGFWIIDDFDSDEPLGTMTHSMPLPEKP